jgi:hypothetical protein
MLENHLKTKAICSFIDASRASSTRMANRLSPRSEMIALVVCSAQA